MQPITRGYAVCIVEVEGADRLLPACDTPAVEGMVVNTHTERVVEARKLVLELLLVQGDHNCLFCDSNGDCKLQDLVYEHGIRTEAHPVAATFPAFDPVSQTVEYNACAVAVEKL